MIGDRPRPIPRNDLISHVAKNSRDVVRMSRSEDMLGASVGEKGIEFYEYRDIIDPEHLEVEDGALADPEDEGSNRLTKPNHKRTEVQKEVSGDSGDGGSATDTGWIDLPLYGPGGWEAVSGFTPKARRIGDTVHLRGRLKHTTESVYDPDVAHGQTYALLIPTTLHTYEEMVGNYQIPVAHLIPHPDNPFGQYYYGGMINVQGDAIAVQMYSGTVCLDGVTYLVN